MLSVEYYLGPPLSMMMNFVKYMNIIISHSL